jgi:hypothetical protein
MEWPQSVLCQVAIQQSHALEDIIQKAKSRTSTPYSRVLFDPVLTFGSRCSTESYTLEDAIEFHAFAPVEESKRETNGIPLGYSLLLPTDTINSAQTLKARIKKSE